jgi:hypothetical protein
MKIRISSLLYVATYYVIDYAQYKKETKAKQKVLVKCDKS